MASTVLVFEGQGAVAIGDLDLATLPPADAQRAIVGHQLARASAHGDVCGVVGQSLGEVSAMVVAGVLSADDAMRFVDARASITVPGDWTMASMTRLSPDDAVAAADGLDLWVVSRNSPADCIVVGTDFAPFVERLGVSPNTYRLLPVVAPYHTPAMAAGAAALATVVDELAWHDPVVPVLSPTGPRVVTSADEARRVLLDALTTPVSWTEVLALGAERWPDAAWRECGPSCSLHRFVWKNGLEVDWGEA